MALRVPAADGYSLAATLPRLGHFGFFREGPTKALRAETADWLAAA